MEDIHGTHKQAPFGWVLWLQAALRARRGRASTGPACFGRLPSGLQQPSAPH